ncbi:MAG TPA: hypothetical protein PK056_06800 [Methylotenera sp.]|nr:hypothetical protein [Methylotenera sp.]
MKNRNEPSKAEHLANILSGNASTESVSATVQRSHRFPIHQFMLIENMAKMANCSVSAMINQVIEVGVDALYDHLPDDIRQQMHTVTQEQVDKANSQIHQKIGKQKK